MFEYSLFELPETAVLVEKLGSSLHFKGCLPLKGIPRHEYGRNFGFLRRKMYRSTVGATTWCPYRHSSKSIEDFTFELRETGVSVEKFGGYLHFKVYSPLKVTPSHQ